MHYLVNFVSMVGGDAAQDVDELCTCVLVITHQRHRMLVGYSCLGEEEPGIYLLLTRPDLALCKVRRHFEGDIILLLTCFTYHFRAILV